MGGGEAGGGGVDSHQEMIDKVRFLQDYAKAIGVKFDHKLFLEDEGVTVRAVDIASSEVGDFYCP